MKFEYTICFFLCCIDDIMITKISSSWMVIILLLLFTWNILSSLCWRIIFEEFGRSYINNNIHKNKTYRNILLLIVKYFLMKLDIETPERKSLIYPRSSTIFQNSSFQQRKSNRKNRLLLHISEAYKKIL